MWVLARCDPRWNAVRAPSWRCSTARHAALLSSQRHYYCSHSAARVMWQPPRVIRPLYALARRGPSSSGRLWCAPMFNPTPTLPHAAALFVCSCIVPMIACQMPRPALETCPLSCGRQETLRAPCNWTQPVACPPPSTPTPRRCPLATGSTVLAPCAARVCCPGPYHDSKPGRRTIEARVVHTDASALADWAPSAR